MNQYIDNKLVSLMLSGLIIIFDELCFLISGDFIQMLEGQGFSIFRCFEVEWIQVS